MRLRNAVYGLINSSLRWHQRLSRALRQAGFVPQQTGLCVWIIPMPKSVKNVSSVDVPTILKTAAADSSVTPETEVRMDHWKRQRHVQGVLGVHVDDLIGGRSLTFQRAVHWPRTVLEFGTWEQSRFRFRGRELSQAYSRDSIKISMARFVHELKTHRFLQTCQRRPGCSVRSRCTLPVSKRCRSATVAAIAGAPFVVIFLSKPATSSGHDPLSLMRDAKSMPDLCG